MTEIMIAPASHATPVAGATRANPGASPVGGADGAFRDQLEEAIAATVAPAEEEEQGAERGTARRARLAGGEMAAAVLSVLVTAKQATCEGQPAAQAAPGLAIAVGAQAVTAEGKVSPGWSGIPAGELAEMAPEEMETSPETAQGQPALPAAASGDAAVSVAQAENAGPHTPSAHDGQADEPVTEASVIVGAPAKPETDKAATEPMPVAGRGTGRARQPGNGQAISQVREPARTEAAAGTSKPEGSTPGRTEPGQVKVRQVEERDIPIHHNAAVAGRPAKGATDASPAKGDDSATAADRVDTAALQAHGPLPASPGSNSVLGRQSSQQVTINQAEVVDQVVKAVSVPRNPGVQTVHIQLHPENLGRLVLRVSQNSAGMIQAVIRAERPEVADALRVGLNDLLQGLTGQGLQVRDVQVASAPATAPQGQANMGQGQQGNGWSASWGSALGGGFHGDRSGSGHAQGRERGAEGRTAGAVSPPVGLGAAAGVSPGRHFRASQPGLRVDLVA